MEVKSVSDEGFKSSIANSVSAVSAEETDDLVESLWKLWRIWRRLSNPVRQGEITLEQYWLLKRLNHRGPLTVGELATGLDITPSSVTIATKRLEKAGMVERRRLKGDERVVEVELTSAGKHIMEEWTKKQRRALTNLLKPLSPEEKGTLGELLRKVIPIE
ncbi:MarR family winged helix-turn-helix transcriptional regulator [Paradesulfitobacterium ferrireducens]|uniref:MarR family winged helix-turn-helix transcriptional regulator n=1 Tax=Paradesulfitobacterium ferrireducens TaxID=2816476 RepID=UPI001A8C46CB|nr:MarR family transcriptional regulator [Paradesulfitobacterium ferrireducens]